MADLGTAALKFLPALLKPNLISVGTDQSNKRGGMERQHCRNVVALISLVCLSVWLFASPEFPQFPKITEGNARFALFVEYCDGVKGNTYTERNGAFRFVTQAKE